MMDKLKMHTPDLAEENFCRLAELFPNAVTETIDESGKVVRAIDADVLRQEIATHVVEGRQERYQFTWPDKRRAILTANAPIDKTLRPCPAESVGRDGTPGGFDSENLYIEGDNLEVLKLLRETYQGKVKMIYIDPPYNTGSDFVYEDDFAEDVGEYLAHSGQFDEQGRRLVQNTEANGRFHTDWLNMMYPRLKFARDLLSNSGVIFISVDDHELENTVKICDEVFGIQNRVGVIVVKSNPRGSMSSAQLANLHEYLVGYCRNIFEAAIIGHQLTKEMEADYRFNDEKGAYRLLGLRMRGGFWRRSERPNLYFPIYINPTDGSVSLKKTEQFSEQAVPVQPSTLEDGTWRWSKEKVEQDKELLLGKQVKRGSELVWDVYQKDYHQREEGRRTKAKSIWEESEINYQNGTAEIKKLLGSSGIFDYPKPVYLLKRVLEMVAFEAGDLVLDFFSGSATTAHAVMQLNAEDGGHRKFIMVQLPEETDEKSEAYKAGYKNICEIGKERIRRAGKKIKLEMSMGKIDIDPNQLVYRAPGMDDKYALTYREAADDETLRNLDIGFRVLKCDESNMKPVYYTPAETEQGQMDLLADNIKEDRTPEDLLFQVMLDMGVELSASVEVTEIAGKKVFDVGHNHLLACFDQDVTEAVITEIAKRQPNYFVMRDSSMANDTVAANFEQIFRTYSPDTVRRVL